MSRLVAESFRLLSAVLLVALLLGGGTLQAAQDSYPELGSTALELAAAPDDDNGINDPLEPVNRVFFKFNEAFEVLLLRPFSEFYVGLLPPGLRNAISNVLNNLNAPVIFVNDVLQGEGQRAVDTAGRFLVNSTVGIGGVFDVAEKMGLEEHDEDFGQTLGVWGVGEGFYLVLPVFGPSSPRDAVGKFFVDGYFDAFGNWADDEGYEDANMARTALKGIDTYAGVMDELAQIKKTSVDFYAAIRSMYRQKRIAEIRNGKESELPPIPDLSFEEDEAEKDIQPASIDERRQPPGG
ncbi:MAG: VacJ family lipoprotein [Rhodospirillales bacterium]|nr:VacJ family lipoprotein [Rhodospirillales bacterium]